MGSMQEQQPPWVKSGRRVDDEEEGKHEKNIFFPSLSSRHSAN